MGDYFYIEILCRGWETAARGHLTRTEVFPAGQQNCLSSGIEQCGLHFIVEGCALVPPRQFIRTSRGFWALPGAVFGGLGGVLGGLGGVLGPLEGVLVSWGRLESFVGRLGGVFGAF